MQELKNFAIHVQKMRLAQTRYFELSAIARKSKTPDDFKASKDMLTMAKELEKDVDQQAIKIVTA